MLVLLALLVFSSTGSTGSIGSIGSTDTNRLLRQTSTCRHWNFPNILPENNLSKLTSCYDLQKYLCLFCELSKIKKENVKDFF